MINFEVLTLNGVRLLTILDISRYDFMLGFRRVVKVLP